MPLLSDAGPILKATARDFVWANVRDGGDWLSLHGAPYSRRMTTPPGKVLAINITPRGGDMPQPVQSIQAIPGRGLEGDRYNLGKGSFQKPGEKLQPGSEATLIENEAIEGLEREHGITITPAASRRNILTQGISLNDLIGKEFTVGVVRMKGIRPCRPCDHLESKTQPGVKAGLANRGGLRAQILTEGIIRVGDPVLIVTPATRQEAVGAGT